MTYQKTEPKMETTFINEKNIYHRAIDSDIKWYEEIRKLTTRQGEDYTKWCLLDYGYIKYHYRLIAIHLSRKKKLDADPKAIQQITFSQSVSQSVSQPASQPASQSVSQSDII